jgi:hypothetical protein
VKQNIYDYKRCGLGCRNKTGNRRQETEKQTYREEVGKGKDGEAGWQRTRKEKKAAETGEKCDYHDRFSVTDANWRRSY